MSAGQRALVASRADQMRVANCLKRAGIQTVGDLISRTGDDLRV